LNGGERGDMLATLQQLHAQRPTHPKKATSCDCDVSRTTFSRTWHGLLALQPIAAGECVIEYKGEVTSWRRAAIRQRSEAGHTLICGLSDGRVIDGSRGGNSARFLNHACAPNCEAIETGDRVFIRASGAIAPATSFLSTTLFQSTVRSPTTSGPSTRVIAAHRDAVEPCWAAILRRQNPAVAQTVRRANLRGLIQTPRASISEHGLLAAQMDAQLR
jgi:hypothetical protein